MGSIINYLSYRKKCHSWKFYHQNLVFCEIFCVIVDLSWSNDFWTLDAWRHKLTSPKKTMNHLMPQIKILLTRKPKQKNQNKNLQISTVFSLLNITKRIPENKTKNQHKDIINYSTNWNKKCIASITSRKLPKKNTREKYERKKMLNENEKLSGEEEERKNFVT